MAAGAPSGYRGVRGAVLLELKREPRLTAGDLARRLRVSLNAVRHHLKELEGEGLVAWELLHRGVGAPGYGYHLTESGERLFPRRYEDTLQQLLDHVVEREGRAAAVALLEAQFERLAERLSAELDGAGPEARMAAVVAALNEQGYMAEGRAGVCCGTLSEHNCAIRAVAERFPEICAAETRFLERTLGGRIERRTHMLGGCSACEYRVRFEEASGVTAGAPGDGTAGATMPAGEERR